MPRDKSDLQHDTLTRQRDEVQEPPLFQVIMHNDDYTTMDFVIMVLESIFGKNTAEATRIMLDIHHQGRGIAGVFTKEIGESKVATVHHLARKHQYPLKCSLEKLS